MEVLDLHEKTKFQLEDVVKTYSKKHGVPDESHYDGAKNTLFGWTDEGKGVWIRPATKASFKGFEDIAKSRPDLGHDMHSHCEIMRLAGAEGVGASCLSSDEIAWDRSSGSFGFKFSFKQPWYQKRAVAQCLKNVHAETVSYYQGGGYVDLGGRGAPEVAAHSVHPDYTVFQDGSISPSGRTSAAALVMASIITLLNDARLRTGKPVLGFLNPLLHLEAYKSFTDTTSGQSVSCIGDDTQTEAPVPGVGVILGSSWNATVGWDSVTGSGVPNFGKLLKIMMDDKW